MSKEQQETILQIPGEIWKVESRRNRSLQLTFRSQEDIPETVRSKLMAYAEQLGWLCFLPGEEIIQPETIADSDMPKLETTDTKTPAQRQRGVLYRIWEKEGKPNPSGQKTEAMAFEIWYRDQMERIIEHFKKRLD